MQTFIWEDFIIRASAVVAGIATLYAIFIKAIPLVWEKMKDYAKTFDRIKKIAYELSPNSGTSIFDAIARIEKRQVANERREEVILDISSVPMAKMTPAGNLQWCNKAFVTVMGMDRHNLSGNGWQNSVTPESREKIQFELEEAARWNRSFACPDIHITSSSKSIKMSFSILKIDIDKETSENIAGWFVVVEN